MMKEKNGQLAVQKSERQWLPALCVNAVLIERLKEIQKELRVKNLSLLRRLAIGDFITKYLGNEKFKKEVQQWFLKTTA